MRLALESFAHSPQLSNRSTPPTDQSLSSSMTNRHAQAFIMRKHLGGRSDGCAIAHGPSEPQGHIGHDWPGRTARRFHSSQLDFPHQAEPNLCLLYIARQGTDGRRRISDRFWSPSIHTRVWISTTPTLSAAMSTSPWDPSHPTYLPLRITPITPC